MAFSVELVHTEPMQGVYHIGDTKGNFATLVVGTEKAFLFDTMMGLGDLRSYVEKLTSLPIIVMNSHCHLDHMGGNFQFEKIYSSKIDWPLLQENYDNTFLRGNTQPVDFENCRKSIGPACEHPEEFFIHIEEGMTFDLGGVVVEAVSLPGHTYGSMGAYVREKKLLLVGDAISPQMCLFLGGQAPLSVYQQMLKKVKALDIEGFLTGHFERLFSKAILDEFEECAYIPESGKKKGIQYSYSLIPKYEGKLYIHQIQNPEIKDMICIIVKE